ncbi:MAG: mitochondrial fission ELM1 family protein [Gammaproteobacteria bacterium]|nr:MAG: mitochondrial fission ELM1 family protein [Gammaproteobacteria bacterium]
MNSLSQAHETETSSPVWVLLGHKAGDNNQVMALAESLGAPFDEKHLRYRHSELLSNILLGPTLAGIPRQYRPQLTPPWPRLVISAGRRNEPVARWIRQQANEPVRLVHVGRPWARPDRFDLIVATPQYALEGHPNVIELDLPLHRISEARLADAAEEWEPRMAALRQPRIALLVGGDSGPFHLDPAKAGRLGREANQLAESLNGSLMVTTSARTPRAAAQALSQSLTGQHFFFQWKPDSRENPFLAFLALADRFIVTGESMSMLTEACATRRPVYIFDMRDNGPDLRGSGRMIRLRANLRRMRSMLRYRALTHRLAQLVAPQRLRRDVGRLHTRLVDSGRAVFLGETFPDSQPPPLPDIQPATAEVLQLLTDPQKGGR